MSAAVASCQTSPEQGPAIACPVATAAAVVLVATATVVAAETDTFTLAMVYYHPQKCTDGQVADGVLLL